MERAAKARTTPLDRDEEAAWRAIARAVLVVPRTLDADLLAGCGLSLAEYIVLVNLSEAPGKSMRMYELAVESTLSPSGVTRLIEHLRCAFPFSARVTIADNGSTDGTWPAACALEAKYPEVRAVHLDIPGRGRALHQIWSLSDAEVLAYMDVDLSTDLNALLPLVAPLLSGHSDVAIGTRLARGSRVVRGPKREIISRCYNLLLRTTLGADFSDAQCGFKAIRADQARQLLPLVEDKGWFFDTELLVLAERAGLRIHEVPVDWTDDRKPAENARQGLKTGKGHLSIQGHDPTTDLIFRDIRIAELPAKKE